MNEKKDDCAACSYAGIRRFDGNVRHRGYWIEVTVKKVSKADEGREIYTGQESVSLVLAWNEHAEETAASDVQWIMCRGRDHLGYQKEEKRQIERRGTMTYVPDLSVFADGEVTFSFWAVDQAGNTGEEARSY